MQELPQATKEVTMKMTTFEMMMLYWFVSSIVFYLLAYAIGVNWGAIIAPPVILLVTGFLGGPVDD
jgi:predicted membrane-bound mannosyltransferase